MQDHPSHRDPTARSPLEFFHGLYLADSTAFGGASAFCWFDDDAAALHYLRHELAPLYQDKVGAERALVHQPLADALIGVERLKDINLVEANQALEGWCELRWAGSLNDLRAGNEPFEMEIQRDFRDNVFGDERGFGPSDLYDWAHHTTHYNG